jgi:ribose 5-phosphate isomerase B
LVECRLGFYHGLVGYHSEMDKTLGRSPRSKIEPVMKQFDIITEVDARGIDIGASVSLLPGGHITPLAMDTLRSRRVTVLRHVLDVDGSALLPVAQIRRIVIGADHSGIALKAVVRDDLRGHGLAVEDIGTHSSEPVDYPDFAAQVARLVARGEADAGIVIDGAGLGSAIAANKIDGIRAAMCTDQTLARYARQHNGANILALGASLLTHPQANDIVHTFLNTPMTEPRYIRRLAKINLLERTR